MPYIPGTHQDQFKHLNDLGHPYRNPPLGVEKCSTRVMFGDNRLFLQFRPLSSYYWTTVHAPDLPPAQFRSTPSSSPPTERQRNPPIETAKRMASCSPEHKSPKMSRTEEPAPVVTEVAPKPAENDAEDPGHISDAATSTNDEDTPLATTEEVAASNADEVFGNVLPSELAIPKHFKSSYARRLSLNSNLPT